jgi:hypothetical protein
MKESTVYCNLQHWLPFGLAASPSCFQLFAIVCLDVHRRGVKAVSLWFPGFGQRIPLRSPTSMLLCQIGRQLWAFDGAPWTWNHAHRMSFQPNIRSGGGWADAHQVFLPCGGESEPFPPPQLANFTGSFV